MTESDEKDAEKQKDAGEKLTLEEATHLVNGYAILTAMWVQEARCGKSFWNGSKDHTVIYLEALGDIVAAVWELWNRTTYQYPILRPVIRRMGASVLNSLQDVVVEDKTLDDDADLQVTICWARCSMEGRMNLPPWRECIYRDDVRCRYSNGDEGATEWKCAHCHDRHADEAKEPEPADEGSDTEEENPEVPADQTENSAVYKRCMWLDSIKCTKDDSVDCLECEEFAHLHACVVTAADGYPYREEHKND